MNDGWTDEAHDELKDVRLPLKVGNFAAELVVELISGCEIGLGHVESTLRADGLCSADRHAREDKPPAGRQSAPTPRAPLDHQRSPSLIVSRPGRCRQ
jgi:hypothetical protein